MNKVEIIAERRENGHTLAQIAQELNVSESCVYWHCITNGIEGKKQYRKRAQSSYMRKGKEVRVFTPEEDQRLVDLDLQGLNYSRIARMMGRSRNTVWARLAIIAKYQEREFTGDC